MPSVNLCQKIEELILEDKLEDALVLLIEHAKKNNDTDLKITLILLYSKFKSLNRDIQRGTISRAESELEKNRMRESLLQIGCNSELIINDDDNLKSVMILNAEDRAKKIGEAAEKHYHAGERKMIRQQANLSSFSIPSEHYTDDVWKDYDGPITRPNPDDYHKFIATERIWLGNHAKEKGCKLILGLSLSGFVKRRGRIAACLRLKLLLDFINQMKDQAQIVISKEAATANITIIEDYFYAESFSKSVFGYNNTLINDEKAFLTHAAEKFDMEFTRIMKKNKWDSPQAARKHAIKTIKEKLETYKC